MNFMIIKWSQTKDSKQIKFHFWCTLNKIVEIKIKVEFVMNFGASFRMAPLQTKEFFRLQY